MVVASMRRVLSASARTCGSPIATIFTFSTSTPWDASTRRVIEWSRLPTLPMPSVSPCNALIEGTSLWEAIR